MEACNFVEHARAEIEEGADWKIKVRALLRPPPYDLSLTPFSFDTPNRRVHKGALRGAGGVADRHGRCGSDLPLTPGEHSPLYTRSVCTPRV
jgi:hypothetical protein